MYSRDASLKKFFVGSLVVFGILVYCTGAGISRNIEVVAGFCSPVMVEKSKVILEETQHIEYQNIEKMEAVLKIPLITGARG